VSIAHSFSQAQREDHFLRHIAQLFASVRGFRLTFSQLLIRLNTPTHSIFERS
jgi:hypothetical protein